MSPIATVIVLMMIPSLIVGVYGAWRTTRPTRGARIRRPQ